MQFPKSTFILPFVFLLNKGTLFWPINLTNGITDRHFISEQFDILFAIFGLVVQKL